MADVSAGEGALPQNFSQKTNPESKLNNKNNLRENNLQERQLEPQRWCKKGPLLNTLSLYCEEKKENCFPGSSLTFR